MRWDQIEPEQGIVDALNHAGVRPEQGTQDDKRGWSERFADGCAIAIADQFRLTELKKKRIKPVSLASGTEPLTPLGAGTSKRIDVIVVDDLLGLEVGVSLKGLNFRDKGSKNFDKNLTGRLYELSDEIQLVHQRLPHCFMAGIFFLPLAATEDKTAKANSSFANAVIKLRDRSGRLDPSLPGEASKCDVAYVGLYSPGDDGYRLGVTRFLNVTQPPPRRGRPRVEQTMSLAEVVQEIVALATHQGKHEWSEPEEDISARAVEAEAETSPDHEPINELPDAVETQPELFPPANA